MGIYPSYCCKSEYDDYNWPNCIMARAEYEDHRRKFRPEEHEAIREIAAVVRERESERVVHSLADIGILHVSDPHPESASIVHWRNEYSQWRAWCKENRISTKALEAEIAVVSGFLTDRCIPDNQRRLEIHIPPRLGGAAFMDVPRSLGQLAGWIAAHNSYNPDNHIGIITGSFSFVSPEIARRFGGFEKVVEIGAPAVGIFDRSYVIEAMVADPEADVEALLARLFYVGLMTPDHLWNKKNVGVDIQNHSLNCGGRKCVLPSKDTDWKAVFSSTEVNASLLGDSAAQVFRGALQYAHYVAEQSRGDISIVGLDGFLGLPFWQAHEILGTPVVPQGTIDPRIFLDDRIQKILGGLDNV